MANLNENDIRLIENHLDGLLTPAEQENFAQRCLNDKIFADEVFAYQNAHDAVFAANRTQLKARLQQHAQQKTEIKPIVNRKRLFAFSAAAAVLVGWFIIGNFFPKPHNFETDFQTNFQPMSSGGIEKSTNTQLTLLDSAYLAYDNRNWETAINLFNKTNNQTPKTLFLKANAYLAHNKSENALPILYALKNNPQFSEHREDVEWLIALCLMRKGDTSELKKISQMPDHFYAGQAKKILGNK